MTEQTQREVVMKLSAKVDPSATQSFKTLSELAKEEVRGEQEYQKLLSSRTEAYHTAERLKKDLAKAGIGAELSEEQKYQKLLKERIASYQTAKRMKTDLAKAGVGQSDIHQAAGVLGSGIAGQVGLGGLGGLSMANPYLLAATAALSAFTLGVSEAEKATSRYYRSLEYNAEKGIAEANPVTRRHERLKDERERGPFMRWLLGSGGEKGYRQSKSHSYQDWLNTATQMPYEQWALTRMSGRELDLHSFDAQQQGRYGAQSYSAGLRGVTKRNALLSDYGRTVADSRAALGLMGASARLTGQAGEARMGAIGGVLANPLYDRESQIEDINRQISTRQALGMASATGHARQQSIAHQMGIATQQEGDLRQRYETAKKEEDAANARKEAARSLGAGEYGNKAEEAKAATENRKRAEEELMQAQQRSLELRKQGEESIKDTIQRESEILRSTLESVQRERQMLKRSQAESTERLGLLHPMQQRTVVGIANKIKQNLPLTFAEKQFASGHRDIFGNYLQKEGARGGQPIMDYLRSIPQLGLQNRERELAKQELKLKQEIQVKLEVDATKALTEQLMKTLRPEILKMMGQINQEVQNELDRIQNQMTTERRRMFPETR